MDAQYSAMGAPAWLERGWFDVLALSDGRAAMLVGDVVEQGIPAAIVARRVRRKLARLLGEGRDLAWVLEQLNRPGEAIDASHATTACVAVVHPGDGRVDYSTCGHHPPLIVDAAGHSRYLEPTGGGILGMDAPAVAGAAAMFADEVLVLFSDGLSPEIRDAMAAGLADLAHSPAAATEALGDPQARPRTAAVCRTMTDTIRRTSNRGGLAVVAVQPRPVPPRLDLTVPAIAASLEAAGAAVAGWLSGLRSSVEDGVGIALAVGEALTNAIQHAFVGAPAGTVRIEASLLVDGVVSCSVRDDGRWLTPATSEEGHRGRGLPMMARVSDWMELSKEPSGTVVELRRRLHHPVIGALESTAESTAQKA